MTGPFLRIYSTKIFYRIFDISISLYLLYQNILSHPWKLNFFVSTRPKYSHCIVDTFMFYRINSTKNILSLSSTPPFLRIYSTRSILSHPWHLHFFTSTRPKYSLASVTPSFLRINSTKIFFCILDTSISTYQLNQNILSHPWHFNFFVSTRPDNILSYPWHINFYVSTRPEYSIASSTTTFLCFYSSRIFYRILDTSISIVSTRPKYSYRIRATPPFLSYLLDQNNPSHPRHLHFFVSTRPE